MGEYSFRLDGSVAMVTGARTGIGQAIAQGLAKAGADIVSVSRGNHDETATLIEAEGRRFLAIEQDLSDIAAIDGILERTKEALGPVDILVNNAGTIRREDAFDFSEKDWDDVMNLNIKSAFFLSQKVGRQLKARGTRGKIINIASLLSFQGGIRIASYTASKSALAGITKLLANEWASEGINVNAIAPGYFVTDNTAALRDDPVRAEDILKRIPAGNWGQPGDLAGAAVFLASSASDYVHGITLPVDGGWLAR